MTRIRILIVAAITAMLAGVVPHVANALGGNTCTEEKPGRFLVDDVVIRDLPDLDSVALGQGELHHRVSIHCGVAGDEVEGVRLWYLLTDHNTGVKGFSSAKYVGRS